MRRGILFQSGLTALQLYTKGHGFGKKLIKDHRRLVLVIFLIGVAIWSQVLFAGLIVPASIPIICQVTTSITSTFDQVSRVALEGFLLWSVAHVSKSAREKRVLGTIIGVRGIVGAVFVGFVRTQFDPTCLAVSTLLPVSVVLIAMDVIIVGIIIVRIFTLELFKQSRDKSLGPRQEQCKGLIFITLGFLVWLATSIAMLLGFPGTSLLLMAGIPGGGLTVLVGIVSAYAKELLLPRTPETTTPESQSPYVTQDPVRRRSNFADHILTSGSPVVEDGAFRKNLFVVNPSDTPRDSPVNTLMRRDSVKRDDYGYINYTTSTIRELKEEAQIDRIYADNGMQRASSGIFGTIFTAPLAVGSQANNAHFSKGPDVPFPVTTRLDISDKRSIPNSRTAPSTKGEKRGIFGKKQAQKPSVRKLGISGPIMADEGDSAATFAKMPTIDLAQAAANERDRREGAGKKLVAMRPAPPPPNVSPRESLLRSVSTRRKAPPLPAVLQSMPAIPMSEKSSGLSVNLSGRSSSASLSPGHVDVRRRSPKSQSFEKIEGEKRFSPRSLLPSNPKGGLPTHPKFQHPQAASSSELQTVMLINEIIYNNPSIINSINKDAELYAAAKERDRVNQAPLSASGSVMHRPRPYTRYKNGDRGMFPSEKSPKFYNHRRSKSGSSISSKIFATSAILEAVEVLPPPPMPPTSARNLARLLPNDTKSMTVDEKIQYLFPAPPGMIQTSNRRSSVPSIPRIPTTFEVSSLEGPRTEAKHKRESKRSTVDFGIRKSTSNPRNTARAQTRSSIHKEKLQSSPSAFQTERPNYRTKDLRKVSTDTHPNQYIRKNSAIVSNRSTTIESHDGTSIWASIHSPIRPVNVAREQQVAKETNIRTRKEQLVTRQESASFSIDEMSYTDEMEDVNIMFDSGSLFDTQERSHFSVTTAPSNRGSFFLDPSEDEMPPIPKPISTWHQRIGDTLPAFSESRKLSRKGARTMPPPTPLLLNTSSRVAATTNHTSSYISEPEIINSPTRALKEIEAQLRRFEEADIESTAVAGTLQRIQDFSGDETINILGGNKKDSRIGLLENLEREMGDHQNAWTMMQHNLSRDSDASVFSGLDIGSRPTSQISMVSSDEPTTQRFSRRLQRESVAIDHVAEHSDANPETQNAHNTTSRAKIWQQRLANAQMEYLEHVPTKGHAKQSSVNFFELKPLIDSSAPSGIVSNCKFEGHVESGIDHVNAFLQVDPSAHQVVASALWQPQLKTSSGFKGIMWTAAQCNVAPCSSPEPAGKDVRPARRYDSLPLSVVSTSLWVKTLEGSAKVPRGLWNSQKTRPKSISTRPRTMRPQRNPKRMTLLADIGKYPFDVDLRWS